MKGRLSLRCLIRNGAGEPERHGRDYQHLYRQRDREVIGQISEEARGCRLCVFPRDEHGEHGHCDRHEHDHAEPENEDFEAFAV